ncbi:MAG: peptide chain release factor N(5)-glutamine methyltransferase [Chromatiaceae bacterium]|nr:peptide chain release factor N(5)-glutamine methyltransferase [Gammaproteobacteria bacterium]MCP5301508.1 peptide chain release factor N(5)-glutamine methyltransferase [Chromatiaceae bacterium]MCP5423072.1 peptide chain release factor N(5)-glutamine methyltransferase [Chromatiaceae bacterium]
MDRVRELLQTGALSLQQTSEQPLLDAQVLLAHALGRDRAWLYAWPEHLPNAEQIRRFEHLIAARVAGHPVAYLIGEREFWSLTLQVDNHTLIPRPESERLVETVLALDLADDARVLDLGTGSGAIALALASERPGWQITASDISPAAVAIARSNAERLRLQRVDFAVGDWFEALHDDAVFDLIVSNPPYVAHGDPHLSRGDVRFEPPQALVSGDDGLDAIRHIVACASGHLMPGGWLWFEHGHTQHNSVAALLRAYGFIDVATRADLAGNPRDTGGRRPPSPPGMG